jgi:hypothetical protein
MRALKPSLAITAGKLHSEIRKQIASLDKEKSVIANAQP